MSSESATWRRCPCWIVSRSHSNVFMITPYAISCIILSGIRSQKTKKRKIQSISYYFLNSLFLRRRLFNMFSASRKNWPWHCLEDDYTKARLSMPTVADSISHWLIQVEFCSVMNLKRKLNFKNKTNFIFYISLSTLIYLFIDSWLDLQIRLR